MDERKVQNQDFITRDGTKLASLKDLYGHLSAMSEDEFRHHVHEQRNDFASWVEHSHGDKFLAQSLRQSKSKEDMQKMIFIALFR